VRRYVLTTRGEWNDLKSKLRNKYTDLTDADVWYTEGKQEEMMDGLRLKLSKTRQELIRILNKL
jgi:hypothetical protein